MEELQQLPLGVQDFKKLREENKLYADKTSLVYDLTHSNSAVFLSRPRRFGKSLLLSTIKYYFLGFRNLFAGLAIDGLEKDWIEYPVLYFDFNGQNYSEENGLNDIIENHLRTWEKEYGCDWISETAAVRFENVIKAASEKTGRRVVVLVDEYDKPLLDTMNDNAEIEEKNRAVFKGVFGVLKKMDAYLRFCMFTGVTKFSKVSIFSDLNQLTDISLNERYNNICGISDSEIEGEFFPYVKRLASVSGSSEQKVRDELRRMYDGYHFSKSGDGMYNPFSLFHCFDENDFGSYWFESATPTFLINKLNACNYDIRTLASEVKASENELKDYRPENLNLIPLFYQSGYLTIKGWNQRQRSFSLAFPNAEVRYGFLNSLAPSFLHVEHKANPFNIDLLDDAVETGNTDGMKKWFVSLFAILPYSAGKEIESVMEQNFQNVIFMALTMMGKYARTEVHSAKGRADCILETADYVYIFEFKRDVPAKMALKQIEEQGYAKPYSADNRTLFKIGVNFSSSERNIAEWEVSS